MNFHTQYPCSVCPIFQLMQDLQILPPRFGGRFCSQELLDSPNVSFPRMRRRTPGVDALREEALAFWWSGRIRPEEKKKRNGSDWMAIQKKYTEGNCVQDEMSWKDFVLNTFRLSISVINQGLEKLETLGKGAKSKCMFGVQKMQLRSLLWFGFAMQGFNSFGWLSPIHLPRRCRIVPLPTRSPNETIVSRFERRWNMFELM